MRQHICNKVLLFIFFSSVLGSGRARQVLGKNGRKLSFVALGVGDFISFLFDVGYGFVVICFTKRTLACEQALHWGFGEGGSEKSRESSTLARSLAIRGEFASRLNELE